MLYIPQRHFSSEYASVPAGTAENVSLPYRESQRKLGQTSGTLVVVVLVVAATVEVVEAFAGMFVVVGFRVGVGIPAGVVGSVTV